MQLIGRKTEMNELLRAERSKKSELVLIYGRRRVGKTYLVEQTFAETFAFRATGVEKGNTRQQLKAFHMRLKEHGDTAKTIPGDWFEAFSRLEAVLSRPETQRSSHGKRVVFLDEFPWFATTRSDFLMAFGEFWNRCGTVNGDYLFIICGSATSWIIGNVIKNTGSLYNRVTCQIFLPPFTLGRTKQYFADREFGWSLQQIAEYQMVFGGLPYFMELLNGNESLGQNIDRLLLSPHAILQHESVSLLESTLKKSPVYSDILKYLSTFRYGVKKQDCFTELQIPKGTFSRAIDELDQCGYIRQYKNPSEEKHPLYVQLTDPFLLFHYAFTGKDAKYDVARWSDFSRQEGRYTNWRGNAFEVLCIQHTEQIKKALGISGVRTKVYPWSSGRRRGGAQVDLVIERDDGIINLCELKYTAKPFAVSANYEKELLHKEEVFREETGTNHTLRTVLVSAQGLAGVAHTEHIAQVLTLTDLFAE